MIVGLIYIAISLLGAIISLVITKKFNIFLLLNIVDEANAFDYCASVYITLIEIGVNKVYTYIIEPFFANLCSSVEATFYTVEDEVDVKVDNSVVIKLNPEYLTASFKLRTCVKGGRHFLKNKMLCLNKMQGFDYQIHVSDDSVVKQVGDDIIIDLFAMCGNKKTDIDTNMVVEIGIQGVPDGYKTSTVLKPEIINNRLFSHNKIGIKFKANTIKVKKGE